MSTTINIIGCGIIGATIAYQLSGSDRFKITVYDAHQPAQASTGAALGVLMGVISQKVKGRAWHLREMSMRSYSDLILELERVTGLRIAHNRQGIVKLLPAAADLHKWTQLATTRQQQQWQLELWDSCQIAAQLPQINTQLTQQAVYSPQDFQIDPVDLTNALVAAAKLNGVDFHFDRSIESITANHPHQCDILTDNSSISTSEWAIITAGLGSTDLLSSLAPQIQINPVLGQAIHIRLPQPLGNVNFQPVLTYEDVHIVPCAANEYWVGATVEFPIDDAVIAQADSLERLQQIAIDLCPDLALGEILRTWSGLRPRPHQRPAPVIERVGKNGRVLVATGHYRNGILLAPATAQIISEMLLTIG
jgi:glycine oxidase